MRPWVYAIASNLARNRLRRERLVRWLPLAPGGPRELVAHPPTGAQEEVRERVAAASAILPPRQREACSLRLLDDLTLDEIAAVTGASLGVLSPHERPIRP